MDQQLESIGLEKFVEVAMKYYENQLGVAQTGLREKAMEQWIFLSTYKEKYAMLEFMRKQIKKHDAKQLKITQFFKPLKTHNPEEADSNYEQETSPQRPIQTPVSKYQQFLHESYWKIKLDNENLSPSEIRTICRQRWIQQNQAL